MAPSKKAETEIRDLLKEYVGAVRSVPPPPNTPDLETKLVEALVSKVESFDRTRHNLAKQLGSSLRDSGTFEPLGQAQLDVVMLRVENTKLKEENAELKEIIKTWTHRKDDWSVRILVGLVAGALVFIWKFLIEGKK
jgi:hypothetical protein